MVNGVAIKYLLVGYDLKVIEECDKYSDAFEKYWANPEVFQITSNAGAEVARKEDPSPCETAEQEKAGKAQGSATLQEVLPGGVEGVREVPAAEAVSS